MLSQENDADLLVNDPDENGPIVQGSSLFIAMYCLFYLNTLIRIHTPYIVSRMVNPIPLFYASKVILIVKCYHKKFMLIIWWMIQMKVGRLYRGHLYLSQYLAMSCCVRLCPSYVN